MIINIFKQLKEDNEINEIRNSIKENKMGTKLLKKMQTKMLGNKKKPL